MLTSHIKDLLPRDDFCGGVQDYCNTNPQKILGFLAPLARSFSYLETGDAFSKGLDALAVADFLGCLSAVMGHLYTASYLAFKGRDYPGACQVLYNAAKDFLRLGESLGGTIDFLNSNDKQKLPDIGRIGPLCSILANLLDVYENYNGVFCAQPISERFDGATTRGDSTLKAKLPKLDKLRITKAKYGLVKNICELIAAVMSCLQMKPGKHLSVVIGGTQLFMSTQEQFTVRDMIHL